MVSDGKQFLRRLRPVFPASRVQYISDLHSKFALRPHHVWKYGQSQNQNLRLFVSMSERN